MAIDTKLERDQETLRGKIQNLYIRPIWVDH